MSEVFYSRAKALARARALRAQGYDAKVISRHEGNHLAYFVDYYPRIPKGNPARKKPGAPSVKTVSLKNFTGKLRINPGVPAGAVVVTGVGKRANLSRKKSKKVAKFMVGSGVPAWKRKGKAALAKLRRNPADKKPKGYVVSGAGWARAYYSLEAAQKAHARLVDRGYYGASVVWDGNRYIVMQSGALPRLKAAGSI